VNAADLTNGNQLIENNCYFGIRPFSNRRWSGTYNGVSFSNLDLDKALSIVLAKIDKLLTAEHVADHFKGAFYESLVGSKKALVENRLQYNAEWVMKDPGNAPLLG